MKVRLNKPIRLVLVVLILAAGFWTQYQDNQKTGSTAVNTNLSNPQDYMDDAMRLQRAFENRQSDLIVTLTARVIRTLSDDNEGSRHQRFIIETSQGQSVLVAHNIDLAKRLNGLSSGDEIRIKGEYEWNDKGGVIHWTHHDPKGRHEGGWIEWHGERFE
jgi:hypothetical protein